MDDEYQVECSTCNKIFSIEKPLYDTTYVDCLYCGHVIVVREENWEIEQEENVLQWNMLSIFLPSRPWPVSCLTALFL